ncbi:DUF1800 family protein [Candidatus Levibacter sp. Uisw_134_01]|jgi:uncharacterized protein (DUF1800 family)|uniref:DUF1800 family protein n=1 Tax=Candidatus Levibacter sp. Uisw_134_01 TaxID=3230999 RepID=UPI003D4B9018
MKTKAFIRRVGFGLRPDENVPKDPLNWAKSQMTVVPKMIWPGRLYTENEMIDIRIDFQLEEDKIQDTEKNPTKAKLKRRKLNRRTGRKFFEKYELAIRHHQAVHGDQPVFERFWHFWGNHFAIVDKNKLPVFNTGPMQREQLRPLMTGNFSDMVYNMTITWPMIKSLDNFKSAGPNSDSNVYRKSKNKRVKGLNENHGRELLELHTISPKAGYTQEDVINTAYIMTGWGFTGWKKGHKGDLKKTGYEHYNHEPGTHKVLGKEYKTSGFNKKTHGKKQLRELVDDLCSSESCRNFIAWKLCRHFICDDPNKDMIKIVTDAWVKSDGMLIDIHKAVLKAAWEYGETEEKFLSPETWLIQIARMTGADWPGDPQIFEYDFKSKLNYKQNKIKWILAELGHLPYRAKQPNGFPDTEAEWLSQEYLVRRIALVNNPTQIGLYKNSIPEIDISKKMVNKNFDNPKELLEVLRKLEINNEGSNSLIALLCSRKVLKV